MEILNYWAIFGLFNLLIASYLELKDNKEKVINIGYLMYGYTLALYINFARSFLYALALILIIFLTNVIISRLNFLKNINLGIISWAFLGYGIVAASLFLLFLVFFIVTIFIYSQLNKSFKLVKPMPFTIMFTSLFFAFNQYFLF